MNFLDLDPLCVELEFGIDNLKAINIAMTEGGSVLSQDVLYVTVSFLTKACSNLRKAIDLGIEQGK